MPTNNSNSLNLKILHSVSTNPWYNLALEEYMLKNMAENKVILLTYKNKNSLLIGRNQNPWKESKCEALENNNGFLARRFSGGGTVYHDLGNLNYSFLLARNLYEETLIFKILTQTLKRWRLKPVITDNKDIKIQNKKVSGTAFHYTRNKACHHGTMLFTSRLADLRQYLKPSISIIEGNQVSSTPSSVENLNQINSDITCEKFKRVLYKNFKNKLARYYCKNRDFSEATVNPDIEKIEPQKMDELQSLYQKYSSWQWKYGRTPDFKTKLTHKNIQLIISVQGGIVNSLEISSSMNNNSKRQNSNSLLNAEKQLNHRLKGNKFVLKRIKNQVKNVI